MSVETFRRQYKPRGTASFDAEELEVSSEGTTLSGAALPIDSDGTR